MGCSIANFAIIEEEPKVRLELMQFMRELGEGTIVQEFASSKEFDKFYFADLLPKPAGKPPEPTPLDGLEPPLIEFLGKVGFVKTPPFKTEKLTLDCAADFQIKSIAPNDGQIFGEEARDWLKANRALEAHLPEELKNQMARLKHAIETKKNIKLLWAIQNKEKELWCLKCEVSVKKDGFQLTLTNWQKQTLKALNRDVQLEESKEGVPIALDVIVFRYTCIEQKDFRLWVTQTASRLKKLNLWPNENRPKFIAIRYDEDNKEKNEFNHPFIDDLICLPLDRLITLQKLEIAMQLPKKASPSFLFVQEASDAVEVAKRVVIERVSDMGLAIRNPKALQVGTAGHFYFKFAGQKDMIHVHGKVALNLKHPENENEFLVFFNYFGIDKANHTLIRNNLNRDTSYRILLSTDPKKFEFNPENITYSDDQKRLKTVVVLDPDEMAHKSMADNIRKEINNVHVINDDSFFSFYQDHLSSSAKVETVDSTFKDFFADTVSFLVGIDDSKFQMALTAPEEGHEILGHKAQELFATPDAWLALFDNPFAKELLTETMQVLPNLKRSKRTIPLNALDKTQKRTGVEFVLEENNKVVRINLRAAETMLSSKPTNKFKVESLDAIIIDFTLLPEDPTAFLKNIAESATAKGMRVPQGGPRLIVLINEKLRFDFKKLLQHNIYGMVFKPAEIRRVLYLVSSAIDNPFTMYNFENIGWKKDLINGRLARESQMVELAEFGVTLKMPARLRAGTMFYLFGSIFKNAPDGNMCARVFHCKEDEAEKGSYLSSLIFFGITDNFLKFTRSYIREVYAAKKSKEGGS